MTAGRGRNARGRLGDGWALEKPAGSCWHVFRRKFVTDRPHVSDALVATLAGMSEETIKIYRQMHPAGLHKAVTTSMRLTEIRA